ncbi:MAG: AraC family transcriptional regulator [Ruminococcaceae bacterium]|nr:AraC family transcriptional regulator [Oscillospiraceae bacterium]
MNYINTLNELSTSFTAKEHTKKLGNVEECKMFFHIHPSAELLLVTKGELTVHILGKNDEKIPEGSCAFLFPFQSHSYDRPEGTEYFRFNFATSLLQAFFAPNQNNIGERAVFPINLSEYEPFFNTVRNSKLTYYKVKGFLYNIIDDYSRSVPLTKKHVDDNVLTKVIAYIDEHKGEHVTMTETAAALGYNDKYLSRVINESAGFGFSTLLSTLRMETASYLLKNTNRTVVDIAIECGFGSERNFYRKFKELTGFTPNEYRASSPKAPAINDAIL